MEFSSGSINCTCVVIYYMLIYRTSLLCQEQFTRKMLLLICYYSICEVKTAHVTCIVLWVCIFLLRKPTKLFTLLLYAVSVFTHLSYFKVPISSILTYVSRFDVENLMAHEGQEQHTCAVSAWKSTGNYLLFWLESKNQVSFIKLCQEFDTMTKTTIWQTAHTVFLFAPVI